MEALKGLWEVREVEVGTRSPLEGQALEELQRKFEAEARRIVFLECYRWYAFWRILPKNWLAAKGFSQENERVQM